MTETNQSCTLLFACIVDCTLAGVVFVGGFGDGLGLGGGLSSVPVGC